MSTIESQDGPSSTESVAVAVHIRPLIEQELDQGCEDCLEVTPGVPQVAKGPYQFTYDYVYGGDHGKNAAALYSESVEPLVEGLFGGYNATVFAYGQTGSGKTYTMGSSFISDGSDNGGIGVIPKAVAHIFERIRKVEDTIRFTVRVGFVEIHKEEIRDLLSSRPEQSHHVHVRELPDGGIILAGAKEIEVESENDMAAVLERGTCMRATGATGMNQRSSRSHAIFTITIEQRKIEQESRSSSFRRNMDDEVASKDSDDEQSGSECDDGVDDSYLCAKMHLVDLAGSERLKRTRSEGQRKEEGIKINQGLLALGNVINALSEGKAHVPYRDSKLTRMLQDSLGGNSRTLMIACVSPANINWEESLNTLRYANRARAIKNKPVVNRDPVAALIASLRQQLDHVKAENAQLRRQLGICNSDEVVVHPATDDLQAELNMTKNRLSKLAAEMHASKNLIEELREDLKSQAEQGFLANMQRDRMMQILRSTIGEEEANRIVSGMSSSNFGIESTEAKLLSRVQELEEENRLLRQDKQDDDEPLMKYDMQEDWLPDDEQYGADEEHMEGLVHSEITEVAEKIALLQAELEAKEDAIAKVTKHASMQVALKKHLEDIQRERDSLAKERVTLLAKIRDIQASSMEERSNLERHYKSKLRELDLKVKQADRKEQKIRSLEATQQRANLKVRELENEIQHIKSQKSVLQKQAERAGKDYNQWKKKRDREFMHLAKEKQAAAMRLMKMEAQNARQQAYLRRKIEEAAAAKKKLQDFIDKRGNARSMSMERNSTFVQHITQPSSQANNKDVLQSSCREHLPSTNSRSGRENWLENELEDCTSSFEISKLLEEEKSKRREVAKRLREVEKKLAALQNPSWWSGVTSPLQSRDQGKLIEERQGLNENLKLHSRKIQEFQSSLVQSKSEEEEKGLGAADISRWSSIQSLKEARIALTATFKVASKYKAQSWELQLSIDELTDELEMLRLRLEIAETEKLQVAMQMGNAEYSTSPQQHIHSNSTKKKSVDPEVSQVLHDLDSMAISTDNQGKSEEVVTSLSEIPTDMNEIDSCSRSIEIHVPSMEPTQEEIAVLAHINKNRQKAGLQPCFMLTESMIQEELEGFPLVTGDVWKPANKSKAEMVADYISLNYDDMKCSSRVKRSKADNHQSPMQSLKTLFRRGSKSPASPAPTNSVSDPNIARSLNSVFETSINSTSINSTDATALIRSETESQSKMLANQDPELSDCSSKEPELPSLSAEESSGEQEKQPAKKNSALGRSSSLRRQNSLPAKKVWIPN